MTDTDKVHEPLTDLFMGFTLDVEDQQFGRNQALQFTATVEVAPDFALPNYKGLAAKRELTVATEADVERAFENVTHDPILSRLEHLLRDAADGARLGPLLARAVPRAAELSRFPSVRRDLAFVVADTVPWAQIAATARTAAGPLLRDVQLFDRYVGQGVESGQKSLAMGLILQDNSRTLTDADVAQVVAQVVAAIGDAHGAKVRG